MLRQELRSRIEKALKGLEEAGRERMHPLDPESRMMVNHGRTELSYNAPAVVDEKSGVIVAADVTNDGLEAVRGQWHMMCGDEPAPMIASAAPS